MIKWITILSPDRVYRYTLWREWPAPNPDLLYTEDPHLDYYPGKHSQYVMFIGLNPSTADETKDDPTVRKCVGFAQRWGFGAICMTNLFAFRATNPKEMMKQERAVGPDNLSWLNRIAEDAGLIIAAWGVNGSFRHQDHVVTAQIKHRVGRTMMCLRLTRDGHPEHPLYVPYGSPIPYAKENQPIAKPFQGIPDHHPVE